MEVVTLGADFGHWGVVLRQSTVTELGGSVRDGWAGYGQEGRGCIQTLGEAQPGRLLGSLTPIPLRAPPGSSPFPAAPARPLAPLPGP